MKAFKIVYEIMAILGIILGIIGLVLGLTSSMTQHLLYILLNALACMASIVIYLWIHRQSKRITQPQQMVGTTMMKGHLCFGAGAVSLLMPIFYQSGRTIGYAATVALVMMVFMVGMLLMFTKAINKFYTSQKETSNDAKS